MLHAFIYNYIYYLADIDLNPPKAPIAGVEFVQGDVTKTATWEKAVETSVKLHGGLDAVVNNVGFKACHFIYILLVSQFLFRLGGHILQR